jgi:hypothetical protein
MHRAAPCFAEVEPEFYQEVDEMSDVNDQANEDNMLSEDSEDE